MQLIKDLSCWHWLKNFCGFNETRKPRNNNAWKILCKYCLKICQYWTLHPRNVHKSIELWNVHMITCISCGIKSMRSSVGIFRKHSTANERTLMSGYLNQIKTVIVRNNKCVSRKTCAKRWISQAKTSAHLFIVQTINTNGLLWYFCLSNAVYG